MITIIIIFIFLVVVFVAVVKIEIVDSGEDTQSLTQESKNPYKKKQFFLTRTEFNFFGVLKQIIGDNYLIFSQVVLSSILDVKVGRFETYKYRNPINRKTLDFVIFDKTYISPLLVIELDDSSHYRSDRAKRDGLVDNILKQSGIGIVHIRVQYSYNIPELSKLILSKLNLATEPKPVLEMAKTQ